MTCGNPGTITLPQAMRLVDSQLQQHSIDLLARPPLCPLGNRTSLQARPVFRVSVCASFHS